MRIFVLVVLQNIIYDVNDLSYADLRWSTEHIVYVVQSEVKAVCLVSVDVRIEERDEKHKHQHHNNYFPQCNVSHDLTDFALSFVYLLQNLCVKEIIHLLWFFVHLSLADLVL